MKLKALLALAALAAVAVGLLLPTPQVGRSKPAQSQFETLTLNRG
ncbi:MAG: hypothetical protein ACK41C_05995 [Phenylobacterium sp.]|jgi:hypothetical protein